MYVHTKEWDANTINAITKRDTKHKIVTIITVVAG